MADIILLHGAAGRKEEMHPLSYAFGDDVTAWSLDLLGHGERPMPDAFGLREMAEDIIAGLDQAGLEKVYVLGHSFGGYIGLLLASRFPDRIAGCCTLAAHLVYDRRAVRQALLILNKERLTQFERENEPPSRFCCQNIRLVQKR
jgi:pimeloyl-ACP methyl ester carboxylesterase